MDQEAISHRGENETVEASAKETTVHVSAERPHGTMIAATMALGAAVVALVVPVFSGGIDPATGVVLLVVLLTPAYLHAAVRRNARRGYLSRSTGYAVAALVVSVVFTILLFLAIEGNKPMCFRYCGHLAQSTAQQATSYCFAASILLYLLSGIVGLFAAAEQRGST